MNKQLAKTKKKKGFTLIELVVVIAILGILAAILIPVVGGFIRRANDSANQTNARGIFNAAAMAIAVDKDDVFAAGVDIDVDANADIKAAIEEFFGTIPADANATITIEAAGTSGLAVKSATYGGWTYDPTVEGNFFSS